MSGSAVDLDKLTNSNRTDCFVRDGREVYAGRHFILDLWGCSKLDDITYMESAIRKSIEVSGATLLHIHLHHFSSTNGISGVALLAESHISVHTWPEIDYAAFDVFMCGESKPQEAIKVLKEMFCPKKHALTEHRRGILDID